MEANERAYGYTTNWFVMDRSGVGGGSIIIGGIDVRGEQWTRVISHRAAHMLLFRLTLLLFPEHTEWLTPMDTLPIRDSKLPTITNQFIVERLEGGVIEVTGIANGSRWTAKLLASDSVALWTALKNYSTLAVPQM
jgi:hypothetical protein